MTTSATGHQSVRRPGPRDRAGHRVPAPSPPLGGVPAVPGQARQQVPHELAVRLVCDNYATIRPIPSGADRSPAVPPALRPDQLVLAQPGRALVRRTHHQAAPARRAHQCPRPGGRHPRLDRDQDPSRSCGPRPPRKSSAPSPDITNGFQTQNTSRLRISDPRRQAGAGRCGCRSGSTPRQDGLRRRSGRCSSARTRPGSHSVATTRQASA